ncbi:MAG: helix-turn-helix domain containing protein [Alphaproteobacteria bacterium]
MGKPHPVELRERVVAFVDEGHTHRAAARYFRISPRFVNDMIKLRRETKALSPKPQGEPHRDCRRRFCLSHAAKYTSFILA